MLVSRRGKDTQVAKGVIPEQNGGEKIKKKKAISKLPAVQYF